MKQELQDKHIALISSDNPAGMWNRDLLSIMFYDLEIELDALNEYAELEKFCGKYYRMSLNDWVESL